MPRILAIDPGNCTGWAFFRDGELMEVGVTQSDARNCPAVKLLLQGCEALTIELPQVYRAGLSKGDPNDLIKVAVGVGRWVERGAITGAAVTLVKPAEWKGQIPKDIHHKRITSLLTPLEFSRIPAMSKDKAHNALDAMGLGLWTLKRLR